MIFAERYTPPQKRRGWLMRVIRGTGIGGAAVVIPLLAVALFFLAQYTVTPPQLYHRTWEMAAQTIYDPTDLGDWAAWEHKFDGQIKTDEDAIAKANEALSSAGDPYTYLMSPERVAENDDRAAGKFVGVGIRFAIQTDETGKAVTDRQGATLPQVDANGYVVVQSLIEGAPAEQAGIKPGDAIKSVDGVSTKDLALDAIVKQIRSGEPGTNVTFVLIRGGKEFPLTVTRSAVKLASVHTRMIAGTDIGYLRLDDFAQTDATEQFSRGLEKLKDARALIVDLRDNPGGFVFNSINISSMFVKQGVVVVIKERIAGDPTHPIYRVTTHYLTEHKLIEESYTTDNPTQTKRRARDRQPYLADDRPVVFLVNEGSASASEMTTGAVKDNGAATVVGEKTFGKGVGQSTIFMPNGTRLHVTSLRYYTPNGTWLGNGRARTPDHGEKPANGITPDVEVKPVKRHFQLGSPEDNQLQRAVDLLK